MRVYLIAAEADGDVAEELNDYLKQHGCIVRVALGQSFFQPAHPGELTVALWSLKTRMSARQIMFTNRAIDAFVDGSLVMGQLDFHPLPFGLTDIEPFDLRSPGMRSLRYNQMLAQLRKIERAKLTEAVPLTTSAPEASSAPGPSEESNEPDNPKSSHDVFVSYAFANGDIVLPLVEDMSSTGANIWIDREKLRPGKSWAGDIVRAIKSSHLFCLMCSAQAYASDNVRREVYLADRYDKPILPVLLDGAVMPEDIEYFLIDRQWLDMTGVDLAGRSSLLRKALAA